MILAIDTATRSAGLALLDPERQIILAEHYWRSHINHTVELIPNLQAMLETQKLTTADLSGIAVALGPGSFTGLRIGMSIGKALAYVHKIDMVAIPTPDIVAHAHRCHKLPLCVVLEAGRHRIVATHYPVGGPPPSPADYHITTVNNLIHMTKVPTLFVGELDAADIRLLKQALGDDAVIASPADRTRRPAHLAEAGWEALTRGQTDNPATLTPIYLHRPE